MIDETKDKTIEYYKNRLSEEVKKNMNFERMLDFWFALPINKGTPVDTICKLDLEKAIEKVVDFGFCEAYEAGEEVACMFAEFNEGRFFTNVYTDVCAIVYINALEKLDDKFPASERAFDVYRGGFTTSFANDLDDKNDEHLKRFQKQVKKWLKKERPNESEINEYWGILEELADCLEEKAWRKIQKLKNELIQGELAQNEQQKAN